MGAYSSTFANGQAAVDSFVSNYDTGFFDDWRNKLQQTRQLGEDLSTAGSGSLALQIAGKSVYRKLYGKGSDEGEGAEGADEAAGADEAGEQAGTEMTTISMSEGASSGASGAGVSAEEVDATMAAQTDAEVAAVPANIGSGAAGATEATEAGDAAAGTIAETSFGAEGATTTVASAAAASGAADAVGAGAAAATGIGDAAMAVGSVALEAVPVVGALAAIGFGLYELFHHHDPPKKPDPSQIPNTPITASARAENVMPNVDGVVDAPASVAAF